MGLGEALILVLATAAAVGGAVAAVGALWCRCRQQWSSEHSDTALRSLHRWHDAHAGFGFMVGNGIAGVVLGSTLLAVGGRNVSSGWACLSLGCGTALLVAATLVALDIEVVPGRDAAAAATLLVILLFAVSLYFTHRAEDLPRLLPGHDGDSQRLQVAYGIAAAITALIPLRALYVSALRTSRPQVD